MLLFIQNQCLRFGMARMLIFVFTALLIALAFFKQMQMNLLLGDSVLRVARNGILVLALLPALRGGLGLNFGLPLGLLCGLVGMILTLNQKISGWSSMGLALVYGSVLAVVVGYFYGLLLNRVKGSEMMVGTYIGFASVSLMSIFWLMFPVKNQALVWAVGGKGLRTTLSLADQFASRLDLWGAFKFMGVNIPTGTLLSFFLLSFLTYLLLRTRPGIFLTVCGANPDFARANGLCVNRYRILSSILSTVLGAIGIVVYAQSYGYVQLYTAPLLMAFPLMACILIGGASLKSVCVSHVIFGTIVFQTLLTMALPVSSAFIGGDISETARIIILNGIILYSLVAVNQDDS